MSENEISPIDAVEEEILKADTGMLSIKRSNLYAMLLPLAFVTGLAAGYIFWGRGQETIPPIAQPAAPAAAEGLANQPSQPDLRDVQGQIRLEIEEDDDPVLGSAQAPITIIEFSDFRCPFCQRFHMETFNPLIEAYPEQIRFIYRDFPVVGGVEAALASECAHEQDAYWEYHNLLFTGTYSDLNHEAYLGYAEQLALDLESFSSCLDEARYSTEVEADAQYAAGLGITGTPTFFINGIPLVGAQPLEVFTQIIDAELGG